ncbi:MAG: hypothetical protein M1821_007471 [Bathelium mastoideum]|nr:MAG: hypothetical protein M1821_007471 [Bathelium mastoideum]
MPNVDLSDPHLDVALQNGMFPNVQSTFGQIAAHDSRPPVQPAATEQKPQQENSKDNQLESMVKATGQLDLDENGYWDYHGHSSGLSFVRRMRESLGDLMGPEGQATPFVKSRPMSQVFESPVSNQESPFESASSVANLPPKHCALQLCNHALNDATALLKVIHHPTFYRLLDRVYECGEENIGNTEQKFLPLLYAVLALGCLFASDEHSTLEKYGYEDAIEQGFQYFKACRQMLDIADCRDLQSLQALIFMILFLQSSAKLSTCYTYVGIALRSALRLGLHRSFSDNFDPIQAESRKRTFWVIRKMDIYVGALLGLPQTLSDDDVDQDLPTEVEDEYITETEVRPMPEGSTTIVQGSNAHLFLVQTMAKIVRTVYPIKNPQQQGLMSQYTVSIRKIREIEKDLQEWKERLPMGLRPSENPPRMMRVQQLLRMAYAHIQMMLYRPFLHYVSQAKKDKVPDPKAYACGMACVSVSRNIVHITAEMKRQGLLVGSHWFIMYTTFFAVLSLVFYSLENPDSSTSHEVLRDAYEGRDTLASLAKRSMAADRCTATLANLFDRLPKKADRGRQGATTSKKRRPATSPTVASQGPGNAGTDKPGNGANLLTEEKRAMTFPKLNNTPNRKSFPHPLSLSHNNTPLDSPYTLNSPEVFGSPSVGSDVGVNGPMSANQPNFPVPNSYQNPALADLQAMMFPSNDPFAYPNEAMTSFETNNQFNQFEPNAMNQDMSPRSSMLVQPRSSGMDSNGNLDAQLFGPLPPYMSQSQQQQFNMSSQQDAQAQLQQRSGMNMNTQPNEMMGSGSTNYMSGTMPATADWSAASQSMRTSGLPGMNLDDIFGGEEWNGRDEIKGVVFELTGLLLVGTPKVASSPSKSIYSQFQALFSPSSTAPQSGTLFDLLKSKLKFFTHETAPWIRDSTAASDSPHDQVYAALSSLLQKIEDPSSLPVIVATAILLPTLALIIFSMSWSRWPSWNGRFSPFSRSTPTAEVKESDYEYVRPEDLDVLSTKIDQHQHHSPDRQYHQHHHHRPRSPSPERDTDVLVLRHKKNSYPVHFPAHSISSGELRIADIRASAGKKTGGSTQRIRLYHKGRNLKDDHRLARDEGLHNASEILCSVGDASSSREGSASSSSDNNADGSSSTDDDGDGADLDVAMTHDSSLADGSAAEDKPKRRRHRRSGKKKSSGRGKLRKPAPPSSSLSASADHLEPPPPQPSLAPPYPGASSKSSSPHRAPSPQPPAAGAGRRTLQTPHEKLDALADALAQLTPGARAFLAEPPQEPARREFEYKKLTETILAQILLKVDGVETEGDEGARARRKELVREAQGWLDRLDRAFKGGR